MLAVAAIPITPEDVAAAYHGEHSGQALVALGDMMLACQREMGIRPQELARLTGITPGIIHHITSVALSSMRADVESDRLTLKEARTLADLGWGRASHYRPDPRKAEIIALFTSGRLSSVYVEPVVRQAKANPQADVEEVVQMAFANVKKVPKTREPPKARPKPATPTKDLQAHILALAGEVEAWGIGEHCEIERLPEIGRASCRERV